jgi:hypothetical protein
MPASTPRTQVTAMIKLKTALLYLFILNLALIGVAATSAALLLAKTQELDRAVSALDQLSAALTE